MATDIRISELNQITSNNDLNQLIINDRESAGDVGITKKISISSLLTPNIVKTGNITDCSVITNKINDKAVTAGKIADNTITGGQISCCSISNDSLATNSVDNRVIKNSDNYTLNCVAATTNITTPLAAVTSKLTVGAIGGGKTVSLNGINYDFPSTEIPNYFLKTDGSGNLAWAEAVPGDGTALVFSEISPVGTIISWAGAALPSDGKWLECNGLTFDGTDFPELSSVLLDTWGTHSGNNYYLPDLQGRVAMGAGTGYDGTDSRAFTLGAEGGKYNHTLNTSQMPVHSHDLSRTCIYSHHDTPPTKTVNYLVGSACTGAVAAQAMSLAGSTRGYICGTGGSQSHNNIQPYAVTRYIIKALPDDIQQFAATTGPGLSSRNINDVTNTIDLSTTEIGLNVTDDFQFDGSGRLELAPLEKSLSIIDIAFDTLTSETILTSLGLSGLQTTGFYQPTPGQYPISQIQDALPIPCSQFFPDVTTDNGSARVFYAHNGAANTYRPWFQYKFTPTRIGKILGSISLPGRGLPETGPNLVVSDITDTDATTLAYEMIENTSSASSGSTHRTLFSVDINESQIGVERTIVFSILSPAAGTSNWFISPAYVPHTSTNATNFPTWPVSLPSNKTTAINNSLVGTKNPQVRLMMYYIAGPDA